MTRSRPATRQQRAIQRREAIVAAAAELALENGLSAVSHRGVAERAQVPLGSTTYYFATLDDLLAAATQVVVEGWMASARQTAGFGSGPTPDPSAAAGLIAQALLPDTDRGRVLAYYELLLGTARHPAVAAVVRALRPDFVAMIDDLLGQLGWRSRVGSDLVLAIVDGAVVAALSEGHEQIRPYAEQLLAGLLGDRG